MEFKFDLQRFKGGKVKISMPDEYQGELQKSMGSNALMMNDLGSDMIDIAHEPLMNIQGTYGNLNDTAQSQLSTSLNSLTDDLTSSNWDAFTITDDRLMDLAPQYQQNADKYSGAQEQLAGDLSSNLSQSNNEQAP